MSEMGDKKGFWKASFLVAFGLTGGGVALSCLVSDQINYYSGNTDFIDTEKQFNTLLEANGDVVSLTLVQNYYDNTGSTVQIRTQDDLDIITSLRDAQLLNFSSYEEAYDYACQIAGDDEVICYDVLQGLSLNNIDEIGYKKYLGREYTYPYAIVLENDQANIYDVESYRRYSDDKIQFTTVDGTTMLKDVDNVKFIGEDTVSDGSIYSYAESLVGSDEKVQKISGPTYQKTY